RPSRSAIRPSVRGENGGSRPRSSPETCPPCGIDSRWRPSPQTMPTTTTRLRSAKIHRMASRIGEIIIDSPDPEAAAAFWCAALGYRITDRDDTGVAIAGSSSVPTILLIRSDDPKKAKTPIHFDLWPTDRDQAAEVERLIALGATRVDVGQRDVHWVVLADPS